uniref:Uncharacterized protein n=1 Tax=Rhizophora mucronata TaxID=61149 RepID=A0A2P2J357_RHIMU
MMEIVYQVDIGHTFTSWVRSPVTYHNNS